VTEINFVIRFPFLLACHYDNKNFLANALPPLLYSFTAARHQKVHDWTEKPHQKLVPLFGPVCLKHKITRKLFAQQTFLFGQ